MFSPLTIVVVILIGCMLSELAIIICLIESKRHKCIRCKHHKLVQEYDYKCLMRNVPGLEREPTFYCCHFEPKPPP